MTTPRDEPQRQPLIRWVKCKRSNYHGFGNSIWMGYLGDTYICEISNWSKMDKKRYHKFPIELCVFLPFFTNDEREYREAKTVLGIKGKAERLVLRWLSKSGCIPANTDAQARIDAVVKELEETLQHSKEKLCGFTAEEAGWVGGYESGLTVAIALLKEGVGKC